MHVLRLIVATLLVVPDCPAALQQSPGEAAGELLYNGIRLPARWPPSSAELPKDPVLPAYLHAPPTLIPIDGGRQLFVDDFLIEQTTLTRTFHRAEYHPANPVLKPEQPWEREGGAAVSMPFCDGIWYDPKDRLFKMWYMGGLFRSTCYATSKDGVHWEKPSLDVRPGTNVVQAQERDGATVWLDLEEKNPQRRFKMLRNFTQMERKQPKFGLTVHFSGDGIHWGDAAFRIYKYGDGTSIFWNPFRRVWGLSIRDSAYYWDPRKPIDRVRRYHEAADFIDAVRWKNAAGDDASTLWAGADRRDPVFKEFEAKGNIFPGLYTLHCAPYESLLLGGFSIIPGIKEGTKLNYGALGFSRDGHSWHRPDREPFLPVGKFGEWNSGYIHFGGGGCLVVEDKLYFYLCARQPGKGPGSMDGERAYFTGLATLRRDGFASMDAAADAGIVTTRPVSFKGKHLFVNVDAPDGDLRAEVIDAAGQPIAPFTRENCAPIAADKTLQAVRWKGAGDLESLAGKPVRFRFHLKNGKLYAFWVSPEESGASFGYVGAGGPGFTGPRDTVGSAALPR